MHTPYYFYIFRIKIQKHVKYAHLSVRVLRVHRDLCIKHIYMHNSVAADRAVLNEAPGENMFDAGQGW